MRLVIGPDDIASAIQVLAARINEDYRDKNPVLVGVLKGSFIFFADLVRLLEVPLEIDFIRAASYGRSKKSSGEVRITFDVETEIKGRHVLVVDDILDTGNTLKKIMEHLGGREPASLRACTLLDKPSRRTVAVGLDYAGIEVDDMFLVGYGLDYSEKYRNFPGIYELAEDSK